MNITDRLLKADPDSWQLHNEGEWSGTNSEFSAFNSGGVECEVGEFLYALVRLLKPGHVLETGTHMGVGAAYMGLALKDNGKGMLDTVEFIDVHWKTARTRMANLGLGNHVLCHLMDVAHFEPKYTFQLILLDTEPHTRFAEFLKFFPVLDPGGFLFIHDLHRHMSQVAVPGQCFAWPYGVMPEAMHTLIASGQMRSMHFPTPRGLTGFYKPHPEDYKV